MRPHPRAGLPELRLLRLPARGAPLPDLDLSVLDARERARGAAFAAPRDGYRYLAAHALLRRMVAAHTGIPAARLRFVRGACPNCGRAHGRPEAAVPGAPRFSLSHSGDLVLAAAAPSAGYRLLGIDVQRTPPPSVAALCAHRLHPDERAELARLPYARRGAAFGRLWARKEAYLKALGTGLCRSPRLDYLGADPARRPPRWTVRDLHVGAGHSAALVFREEPGRCDQESGRCDQEPVRREEPVQGKEVSVP